MKNLLEALLITSSTVCMGSIMQGETLIAALSGFLTVSLFYERRAEQHKELESLKAEAESVEATPSAGSYKPETNS